MCVTMLHATGDPTLQACAVFIYGSVDCLGVNGAIKLLWRMRGGAKPTVIIPLCIASGLFAFLLTLSFTVHILAWVFTCFLLSILGTAIILLWRNRYASSRRQKQKQNHAPVPGV